MTNIDTDVSRACEANDLDAVKELLVTESSIPDVRVHGTTLLHIAILSGSENIAKFAIEQGIDVNATTEAGCTPLHWVARTDLIDVARLLLEKGAAPNCRTNDTGETPCDFAIGSGRKDMAALLESYGGTRSPPKNRHAEVESIEVAVDRLLQQIDQLVESASTEDERLDVEYGIGEVGAAMFLLKTRLDELVCLDKQVAARKCVGLLEYGYGLVRAASIECLGHIRSHESVPAIIHALGDDSPVVCDTAITALGQIGSSEAVPPLIAALEDSSRRGQAAKSLALIGDDAALGPLLDAMGDASDDLEKDGYATADLASIIESIGSLGNPALANRIVEFLDPSYYSNIRVATLKALVRIGNADCVTVLQSIHEDAAANDDERLRAWVIGALCSCGDESIGNGLLAALEAEFNLKALEELHGGDLTFRYEVARALGATGVVKFCDFALQLVRKLYSSVRRTMPDASQTAVPRVLGDIGTTKAVELLREMMIDKHTGTLTRDAAAEALVKIGNADAVEALAAATMSTRPDLLYVEHDVEKHDGYSAIEEIMPDSYYVAVRYLNDLGYDQGIVPAVKSRVVKRLG